MIGAVIGDVVGSAYEFGPVHGYSLPLFLNGSRATDDSVLIAATAEAVRNGIPFDIAYRTWFWKFRHSGFSSGFHNWCLDEGDPGESDGNGAALRGIACGYLAGSLDEAVDLAFSSAICSHSYDAARYSQAVAISVYMAKSGFDYFDVVGQINELTRIQIVAPDVDAIHLQSINTSRADETVPLAIWIGLVEQDDFVNVLRRGIYVGGDVDTILAIACGIAEHRVAIPDDIRREALRRVPGEILDVILRECV